MKVSISQGYATSFEPVIIHEPANTFRITSVWVFISEDSGGDGMIAAPIGAHGQLLPLIAADFTRLQDLRKVAQDVARMTKKKIKLIKLTVREDLETIG